MTERRRFFPSKRVQQVPGRSVELDVQLQPNTECAGGACECDVDGVAWLGDWFFWRSELQPAYMVKPTPTNAWMLPSGSRVDATNKWLTGCYLEIPPEYSDQWESESELVSLRAMVMGRTLCDVKWTWSLNTPELPDGEVYSSWWDGLEVKEQSGTLLVRVLPGVYWGETAWWAELTATATCAGKPVGTLVMRPGFNLGGEMPEIE